MPLLKQPPTVEQLTRDLNLIARRRRFLDTLGRQQPINAVRGATIGHLRYLRDIAFRQDRDLLRAQAIETWDLDYDTAHMPSTDFNRLAGAINEAARRSRFK